MNANTINRAGRSFSELLAMIRLGYIDAPVTVLTVDLDNDLILVDHGDIDVIAHESHASIDYDHYTSAGQMADVITGDMANWGPDFAAVWFAGERVHYSHCDAVDPWVERKGGTGENN